MNASGASPTLIGLPFDGASSFLRGAALAPPAIRAALHSPSTNGWSESLIEVTAPDALRDAGDLDLNAPPPEARARIEHGVGAILAQGGRPIALGGDHSVTYPIIRAFGPEARQLTVVQIDAHPDLYDEFDGDPFSHACQFARLLEEGRIERLVQVGIRTMNAAQMKTVRRFGVEVIDMNAWIAGTRPAVDGEWYLSLDIDGVDPAYAPGVSHHEAGGLTPREVLAMIASVGGRLRGADIVEFNPTRDPSGITAPLCAKLVKEIAARMIADTSV